MEKNFYLINKKINKNKITLKNWFKNTKGNWDWIGFLNIDFYENFENEINENFNKRFNKNVNFKIEFISKNKYDNEKISSIYLVEKKHKLIIRVSQHYSNLKCKNDYIDIENEINEIYQNLDINLSCDWIKTCWWNLNINFKETFIKEFKEFYSKWDNNTFIISVINIKDLDIVYQI